MCTCSVVETEMGSFLPTLVPLCSPSLIGRRGWVRAGKPVAGPCVCRFEHSSAAGNIWKLGGLPPHDRGRAAGKGGGVAAVLLLLVPVADSWAVRSHSLTPLPLLPPAHPVSPTASLLTPIRHSNMAAWAGRRAGGGQEEIQKSVMGWVARTVTL